MTIIESFVAELKKEAPVTRKMLSPVPENKFDWQPHPKSMTLKRLAEHVAELPSWIPMAISTPGIDLEDNEFTPEVHNTTSDIVAYFERNLDAALKALSTVDEASLEDSWTLSGGGNVYSVDPKRDVIRMALSQSIHHRAQLGVFLRLLDIPIPGSYGPSADEHGDK